MRATIGFRIYVRVLSNVQKEEKEREPIFGVALHYDIFHRANGNIPEVWLHATPLLTTLM